MKKREFIWATLAIILLIAFILIIGLSYKSFKYLVSYSRVTYEKEKVTSFEAASLENEQFDLNNPLSIAGGPPDFPKLSEFMIRRADLGYGLYDFSKTRLEDNALLLNISRQTNIYFPLGSVNRHKEIIDFNQKTNNPLLSFEKPPRGFIVEFKEEPTLKKKAELENEILQIREKASEIREKAAIIPGVKGVSVAKEATSLEEKALQKEKSLESELDNYKEKISSQHRSLLMNLESETHISGRLAYLTGKAADTDYPKVLEEFTDVFNGIALDISQKEVEFIKKSSYVKKVYPNLNVRALLSESAPLINADDVWALQDSQGRNIRGQGVVIAVIDTGVDYTHLDLGNCTQGQFLACACSKVIGGYDFVNDDS